MPENHDVGPRGAGPALAFTVRDELHKLADERRNRAELSSGKPRLDPVSAPRTATREPTIVKMGEPERVAFRRPGIAGFGQQTVARPRRGSSAGPKTP